MLGTVIKYWSDSIYNPMSHKLTIISKVNLSAYAKWGIVSSASRQGGGKKKTWARKDGLYIYIKRPYPSRPTGSIRHNNSKGFSPAASPSLVTVELWAVCRCRAAGCEFVGEKLDGLKNVFARL